MNYGVDYYPEHWPRAQMQDDIRQMKELGLTVVRVGEFAWSIFEPAEGQYDFSFFDCRGTS
jgi:beta-galactosidase